MSDYSTSAYLKIYDELTYARSYLIIYPHIKDINLKFYYLLAKRQATNENLKSHKFILSAIDSQRLNGNYKYFRCIKCNHMNVIFGSNDKVYCELSCDETIIKNIIE